MDIELRWLRAFAVAAEEMHFSRAARRLHLAQPALTAQIGQLERAVGARLFERTNRVAGLTAAGAALLPEARRMLETSLALPLAAQRALRGESGALRLGLIPPAATQHVADSLRRFTRDHPLVEVQLRQDSQERLLEALASDRLDLVLGREPGPGWGSRRLFAEEQGIVLRRDDPLARRRVIPLRELDGRQLITLRNNPHFGRNLLDLAARHRVALSSAALAEDFPSLQWMVRAGSGIAPWSLLLSDLLPAGLVALPIRPAPPRLGIHAIWRGKQPTPASRRWLETLRPRD